MFAYSKNKNYAAGAELAMRHWEAEAGTALPV